MDNSVIIWSNNQIPASGESLVAKMTGTVSADGLTLTNIVYDFNLNYKTAQQVLKCKISEIKMKIIDYQGVSFNFAGQYSGGGMYGDELISKTTEVKGTHVSMGSKMDILGVSPDMKGEIRINISK